MPPRTRLTGWRFLIRSGDRAVAAAETMLTADGWAFSHFFEGPYLASTERALRQAESHGTAPTSRGCCPCPSSTCSRCGCTATRAPTPPPATPPPTDLLVPLAPAPPGIAAHRPHRVAELLPVLTLGSPPPRCSAHPPDPVRPAPRPARAP